MKIFDDSLSSAISSVSDSITAKVTSTFLLTGNVADLFPCYNDDSPNVIIWNNLENVLREIFKSHIILNLTISEGLSTDPVSLQKVKTATNTTAATAATDAKANNPIAKAASIVQNKDQNSSLSKTISTDQNEIRNILNTLLSQNGQNFILFIPRAETMLGDSIGNDLILSDWIINKSNDIVNSTQNMIILASHTLAGVNELIRDRSSRISILTVDRPDEKNRTKLLNILFNGKTK